MDAEIHIVQERENKRRGMVGSIVVHAIILILVLIPFITFPIPPPGEQGILVSLGMPDVGSGDDRPEMQNKEIVPPTPPAAAQPVPEKEPEPEVKEVSAKVVDQNKEIITTESPEEIAIKKAEEEEAIREREAELQRQREIEDAKRQAQLEADAEAKKQADYDNSKKQFGDLLSGTGKGNTDTPGNQGDPNGDPDASILEGISTGSGMIGGGLSDRGVIHEPVVEDKSQERGRVVVDVCVDRSGKVISAIYTQRGSTTTNSDLRALAERSARKFIFSKGEVDKQCGTVTIDFKLQ